MIKDGLFLLIKTCQILLLLKCLEKTSYFFYSLRKQNKQTNDRMTYLVQIFFNMLLLEHWNASVRK